MRIIIDNSNLSAGGGIQVALSFLDDLKNLKIQHEFHVIQSPNISKVVKKEVFPNNFHYYDIKEDIHMSLIKRLLEVKRLENVILPDCIFTVFGPSYHKSKFPKIVGFALPYILYTDSPFFKIINLKEKLKLRIMGYVKTYFFQKNSNVIIFETDDANKIFSRKISSNIKTFTVSNTLNSIFNGYESLGNQLSINEFNILCLSANYPHKNLKIIPEVIKSLCEIQPQLNFKFNISANKSDFEFDCRFDKYINYLGRVEVTDLPNLYEKMDVLFMPTLLEVFSTTYLEAMFMKVPIVCSDMSFARDICKDAALFCEPTNPYDYANKLLKIRDDEKLKADLIERGARNVLNYGSSMDRTKRYLEIIQETISDARN